MITQVHSRTMMALCCGQDHFQASFIDHFNTSIQGSGQLHFTEAVWIICLRAVWLCSGILQESQEAEGQQTNRQPPGHGHCLISYTSFMFLFLVHMPSLTHLFWRLSS